VRRALWRRRIDYDINFVDDSGFVDDVAASHDDIVHHDDRRDR